MNVLTWNIAYGHGPGSSAHEWRPRLRAHYEERLAAVAAVLRDPTLDVVLLQEVDFASRRSHGVDQLAALAAAAGYPHAARIVAWRVRYLPYPGLWPGRHLGRITSGGAILSRWPLAEERAHLFPKPRRQSALYNAFYLARYAQEVTVATPQGPVSVVNAHLEDQAPEEAAAQCAWLAARAAAARGPTVVGGDLNTARVGALAAVASAAVGAPTYPGDAPTTQLDHLFAAGGLACEAGVVLDTGDVSDHRPLRARFLHPSGGGS